MLRTLATAHSWAKVIPIEGLFCSGVLTTYTEMELYRLNWIQKHKTQYPNNVSKTHCRLSASRPCEGLGASAPATPPSCESVVLHVASLDNIKIQIAKYGFYCLCIAFTPLWSQTIVN
jgi:hypothetical protein